MTSPTRHAIARIAFACSLLGASAACNGVASTTVDEDAEAEPEAVSPEPGVAEGADAPTSEAEDTGAGADPGGAGTTGQAAEWPTNGDPVWADVLTIDGGRYLPETLLAGADRELPIVNEDDVAHTVTAFDGNFDVTLQPGERVEIQTPPEPGAYRYSCRFHPEMRGMLDVM